MVRVSHGRAYLHAPPLRCTHLYASTFQTDLLTAQCKISPPGFCADHMLRERMGRARACSRFMPSGQTSMTNTSCRVACVPNALSSSPAALLRCGRAPMICALEPLINYIRMHGAHAMAVEERAV